MIANEARFEAAIAAFDAANADDPRRVEHEGDLVAEQLLYARRMTSWLARLEPRASEALRLAARSQHIRRWEIPRSTYPDDRQGYHCWRRRLYDFHAEVAGTILRQVGYDDATIGRVQALLGKHGLKSDPEMQLLEDVICCVFLEHHLAGFAAQQDRATLLRVLRRTWAKMSPRGRAAALGLELPAPLAALLAEATSEAND